jgi:hypothetical protein
LTQKFATAEKVTKKVRETLISAQALMLHGALVVMLACP